MSSSYLGVSGNLGRMTPSFQKESPRLFCTCQAQGQHDTLGAYCHWTCGCVCVCVCVCPIETLAEELILSHILKAEHPIQPGIVQINDKQPARSLNRDRKREGVLGGTCLEPYYTGGLPNADYIATWRISICTETV